MTINYTTTIEKAETTPPPSPAELDRPSLSLHGRLSVPGRRRANEDSAFSVEVAGQDGEYGILTGVADGMGGEHAGETAAREGTTGFLLCLISALLDFLHLGQALSFCDCVVDAFAAANQGVLQWVAEHRECYGMGTTLTAGVIHDQRLYLGSIGDSRCYRWRTGKLTRVTRDHSVLQHLIDSGALSEEDAFDHPQGNVITKCLGGNDLEGLQVTEHELESGDILIFCSDGLWKFAELSMDPVCESLSRRPFTRDSLAAAADELVDAAIRNKSDDNISVALVWCGPVEALCSDEENRSTESEPAAKPGKKKHNTKE